MWLLSTDRAELRYFGDPRDVPGGYAILSHVWDEHEETFQDIKGLEARCKTTRENPRDLASPKVRECCKLAESHGLEWIWDDTCCINKESSAELSEAINSMFRWYTLSRVCYAYLRDVPSDDNPRATSSAFRKSRWHERGWTLQELIAPVLLLFVSLDWKVINGKGDLADVLTEITRIPEDCLRARRSYADYSIAARMSWAARRKTTRIEDEAYSLMGLFHINMPTLYGEGRNAFRRLQEEILKKSVDSSIFAWGLPSPDDDDARPHDTLFASSPRDFLDSDDVCFEPSTRLYHYANSLSHPLPQGVRIPTFDVTSYGVLASMSVAEDRGDGGDRIGLLLCTAGGMQVSLTLTPLSDALDPSRPMFEPSMIQFVMLHEARRYTKAPHVWSYRELYITSQLPTSGDQGFSPAIPLSVTLNVPFHLNEQALRTLTDWKWTDALVPTKGQSWTGRPPATLMWTRSGESRVKLCLHLGVCDEEDSLGVHWTRVEILRRGDLEEDAEPEPKHHCATDHITQWAPSPRYTRTVTLEWHIGFSSRDIARRRRRHIPTHEHLNVTVSFSPSPFKPGVTMMLDSISVEPA